jgi:hypothetical protein
MAHRCTECRKWFAPAVTAAKHQRVCGEECRHERRNKLARRRRRDDLEEHRADERHRQKKRREAVKLGECHEPASAGKCLDLLVKLQQVVDKAARLSRATFRREAIRILRKTPALSGVDMDGAGRCHALASALGTGENGSRSVVGVDGVTDRDGSGSARRDGLRP